MSLADEIGFLPHRPGAPEAINSDSFPDDVLRSPVPVLVEFWAARCGPCRRLSPELAIAAQALAGKVAVFTVHVDEEPDAAALYAVHAIPALLLFVDGNERARRYGFVAAPDLIDWMARESATGRETARKSQPEHSPTPAESPTCEERNLPMKLTWNDAEDIGIALSEKFPDLDPLTVRFTDLHKMVVGLSAFTDDPQASNEPKLEAIQMAWHEEWKDANG